MYFCTITGVKLVETTVSWCCNVQIKLNSFNLWAWFNVFFSTDGVGKRLHGDRNDDRFGWRWREAEWTILAGWGLLALPHLRGSRLLLWLLNKRSVFNTPFPVCWFDIWLFVYQVNLVSEHIWCKDFLVRSFYLKNVQTQETRTLTQFHLLSWPGDGIPTSTRPLLDFRR